ncbi:MAG: hypothetical protein H6558_06995 [Lewinellaceae bacterium]|nr:hypothetical protein [Lewinellaceae bacterium]MCB9287751.1 hypothetical protein [Lewinellaceae bacterium]
MANTSRTFGKKSSDVLRLSLLEGDSLILVAILQEGSENWRYGWITPTSDDPMIWITENMLTEQCPVVYIQTIPHQYWSIYLDAMEIDGRRPLQRLTTTITEQEFNELGHYPLFQPLELFSRYAMGRRITTSDPEHGNYDYNFFRVGPPNLNFQPGLPDLDILEQEDGGISAQLDMNNDYLQVIWEKRKEESPFGSLFAKWIVNSDFSEPFYFPELPPVPYNIIPEELHQAEFELHRIQTVKDSRIDGYNAFLQRLLLSDTPIWEEDPGLDYSLESTSRYFE